MSFFLYLPIAIISWTLFHSFSMSVGFADPASLCCQNSHNPHCFLKDVSQPSLRVSLLSWGIFAWSANCCHFFRMIPPVRSMFWAFVFAIHSSSILVTSGCSVCLALFVFASVLSPSVSANCSHHFGSSLSHAEMMGCLRQRFGYMLLQCQAVLVWLFSVLWWCQFRISIRCRNVAFSFLVNTGFLFAFSELQRFSKSLILLSQPVLCRA